MSRCVRREPIYFGPETAQLFGWLHVPRQPRTATFGIVICPPVGHEYVSSHRSMRFLADQLAAAGILTLRFDYHGVGDSSGFDSDRGRVTDWVHNIHAAQQVLTDVGCGRIGLIGVRLGGLLATLAAAEHEVDSLILWGTPSRGRNYMREMRAMHMTSETTPPPDLPSVAEIEAGGFIYTSDTIAEIEGIQLVKIQPRAQKIMVIERDDFPQDSALIQVWKNLGIETASMVLPGFMHMLIEPHRTVVPEQTVAEIVAWVKARAHELGAETIPSVAINTTKFNTITTMQSADTNFLVRESIMKFGNAESLFGITTEPAVEGKNSTPWVILTNAGATPHTGPNRLYVLIARALARQGFRTLRMDLPGLGDSYLDSFAEENRIYTLTETVEVAAAITSLRERFHAVQIVLMGLCSGAFVSFHASLQLPEEPITESVLINPLTMYWKPGMTLEQAESRQINEWVYYRNSFRDWARWRKLLAGGSDIRAIAASVAKRIRVKFAALYKYFQRHLLSAESDLDKDLRVLTQSGRMLTLVFSRSDPGYEIMKAQADSVLKRLIKQRKITIWFNETGNHTFTRKVSRNELIESLVQHFKSRYQQ